MSTDKYYIVEVYGVIALGILIATVVGFAISAIYYSAVPAELPPEPTAQRPMAAQLLVELLRNLAVAALVAGLLATADWSGPAAGPARIVTRGPASGAPGGLRLP